MPHSWRLLLLFISMSVMGCAVGGGGSLTFNGLRYPVSMSPHVADSTGRPYSPREFQVVGTFRYQTRFWGILYSYVSLTGHEDVSRAVNDQVQAVFGDGVARLAVAAESCGWNKIPILPYLPIWPGCSDVLVTGDIVKLNR